MSEPTPEQQVAIPFRRREMENRLLGVWPLDGTISQHRAHYLASVELAKMCADHKVLPCGPHRTIILRTLADCIGAARELGVRSSRLMFLLEELATDTPLAVTASVAVAPFYLKAAV